MSGRGLTLFQNILKDSIQLGWVGYPRKRIETVGSSIAVGRVLGASTLPFYSQPESQIIYLLYSFIKTVVGVSGWCFEWSVGSSQGKNTDDHFMKRQPLGMFAGAQEFSPAQVRNTFIQASKSRWNDLLSGDSRRPVLFCMPLVSLN